MVKYRKIKDAKERLRIVLEGLKPGINKSELCRREGIYLQQLNRWTEKALAGAETELKSSPRKKEDFEKEMLKNEVEDLKEMLVDQSRELLILKKKTSTW